MALLLKTYTKDISQNTSVRVTRFQGASAMKHDEVVIRSSRPCTLFGWALGFNQVLELHLTWFEAENFHHILEEEFKLGNGVEVSVQNNDQGQVFNVTQENPDGEFPGGYSWIELNTEQARKLAALIIQTLKGR